MSIYDNIHMEQIREAMRHNGDPEWCPHGGTSLRRYHEVAHESAVALHAELDRRVAADKRLWIKTSGGDSNHRQTYVGWHDDPGGEYYLSTGVEHHHHLAPEQLRTFGWLVYSRFEHRDDGIGERYFEPPYAHDATLRTDHLMSWLNAHRRALGFDKQRTDATQALTPAAAGGSSRERIEQAYDAELPEEMGSGPFSIFDGVDNGVTTEPCTVVVAGDVAFCVTCQAHGHLDGYVADDAGVERWHREL